MVWDPLVAFPYLLFVLLEKCFWVGKKIVEERKSDEKYIIWLGVSASDVLCFTNC